MNSTHRLIAGRVLDDRGEPLAKARVFLIGGPASFPDIAALTGEDGRFALSAPSSGTYQLQAVADGFAPRTVDVAVGGSEEAPRDIRLEAEAGRVRPPRSS